MVKKTKKGVKEMIKQNLFKCNQLERSGDEVTARAGVRKEIEMGSITVTSKSFD
jgi:hypothetical protein